MATYDDESEEEVASQASTISNPVPPMASVISRLQEATCEKPVLISFARNRTVRPAIVEETALSAVSKYFLRCFDVANPYAYFKEGEVRKFTFADHTPETIKVFLFWLEMKAIPGLDDLGTGAVITQSEYQTLLARAWCFAADKEVKSMQNDVVRFLFKSFHRHDMEQDVLQEVIKLSRQGCELKRLVLEEALWLEEDGSELFEGLEVEHVVGWSYDMIAARRAYEQRHRRRGEVEAYLVEV